MNSIIAILGDQLNYNISSLKNCDKEKDVILMCEVLEECSTPKHHKKKIAFILSSMRHFADELKKSGFNILYVKIDDQENTHSFKSEILRYCKKYSISKVKVTHPGEYRVLQSLNSLTKENINLHIIEDDRFLCSIDEFQDFSKGKKSLLMESFYRQMRIKYDILMDGNKPIGGKWNYDSDNRRPPTKGLKIPNYYQNQPDEITKTVITLVKDKFSNHFGDVEPFYFAVNRNQAIFALKKFINERLENFGTYQDAMIEDEDFMFHSHIGFYLNNGLLEPLEVIKLVEEEHKKGRVNINSAEGFIRQILGWREYVRGIYWLKMPEYKALNFLNAQNKLPEFYWSGDTKMNCIKECIRSTKKNSYAHHIQRLMVLGNFALISGLDPYEVNEWYLIVYADAYEWVELPNVSGMVLFADGGVLATKPYAASGSYINKMSNYCKKCSYKVKEKNGEEACPFNYLYWNFLLKNRSVLSKNHRMAMTYRVLEKFDKKKIENIKNDSQKFLNQIYDK
ncbi:MAG: deoxyribodipyrimidine photolyase-related protein [Rickettsiales bacterium]|jgi:deoxyribodipyrimidine photolyase-related protein